MSHKLKHVVFYDSTNWIRLLQEFCVKECSAVNKYTQQISQMYSECLWGHTNVKGWIRSAHQKPEPYQAAWWLILMPGQQGHGFDSQFEGFPPLTLISHHESWLNCVHPNKIQTKWTLCWTFRDRSKTLDTSALDNLYSHMFRSYLQHPEYWVDSLYDYIPWAKQTHLHTSYHGNINTSEYVNR